MALIDISHMHQPTLGIAGNYLPGNTYFIDSDTKRVYSRRPSKRHGTEERELLGTVATVGRVYKFATTRPYKGNRQAVVKRSDLHEALVHYMKSVAPVLQSAASTAPAKTANAAVAAKRYTAKQAAGSEQEVVPDVTPDYEYILYSAKNQCSQYLFAGTSIKAALAMFARRGEVIAVSDIRILNVATGAIKRFAARHDYVLTDAN